MDITNLQYRLYARLKAAILGGEYAACRRFPTEQRFARELGVARNTLRAALARLESEQLVRRERSKGTFPLTPTDNSAGCERYLFCNGVAFQKYATQIVPQIIQGVERAIAGRNIEIDFCPATRFSELSVEEFRTVFRSRNIRGVMIYNSNFNGSEPLCQVLNTLKIPAVLLYCRPDDPRTTGYAAIPQNTTAAWQAALEYLRHCGRRRVVTVGDEQENVRGVFTPESYAELLNRLELDPAPELVVRAPMTQEAVNAKFAELFTVPPDRRPDAVLCYSDFWAPLIYRALRRLNLVIPEQVAVMGYCGSAGCEYLNPPLSTVAIQYSEVGRIAVQMLDHSQNWYRRPGGKIPLVMTPFLLKTRGSTVAKNTVNKEE